jgi:hypothetical protein
MSTQAQNLSREMTLYPMRCVSYLIGVYLTGTAHPANQIRETSHESRATLARRAVWRETASTSHESRTTSDELVCKTNPICKKPKSTQPHFSQRVTTICPISHYQKRTQTNPNEPKTNPIFRSSGAPEAKTNPNEPKTNPIKPNFKPRTKSAPISVARLPPDYACSCYTRCRIRRGACTNRAQPI